MPKVSVIIPTYNRANLLPECLKSVLAQSFQDFEIIVIDDGSTDNTQEIVSAFPVRCLCQENGGPAAAYNKGIELATGEYIAFLDSDDVLLMNALEKGVEILDRHPEAGFSYGQAYLMDEKGRIFGFRKSRPKYSCVREDSEEIRELLIFGNHIPHPTVMVRRSCLEEVGVYNLAFRSCAEDFELWVRLAQRYATAYIAEPLAKYRVHSQAICSTLESKEIEQNDSVILESILNDARLGPILSPQRASAYAHLYLRLAGCAYDHRREMETVRDYLMSAMKTHPSGFLKSLWLPWIILLVKTWIPLPVLALGRSGKRYLNISAWRRLKQLQTVGKGSRT